MTDSPDMLDSRVTAGRAVPRRRKASTWSSLAVFLPAALGVVAFYRPTTPLHASRVDRGILATTFISASASPNAFGRSGEVKVRFAMPGAPVEYPIEVGIDPSGLSYEWVRVSNDDTDRTAVDTARDLTSDLVAPSRPGFYRLALLRGTDRRVLSDITVAVLVPFTEKLGSTLNGYRIGTYLAERVGATDRDRPLGFVQIDADQMDLQITKHLRLADFISRDGHETWPRYAALDVRLLDKLELVFAEVANLRGSLVPDEHLGVSVNSGFRTPLYNRKVRRSAKDSRHQYGDAADIAIDANADGRMTSADTRVVAKAVDKVEAAHPDLVGGLGLYTSGRTSPYVHIDTRGRKARWRG